jgi:hypothetical protein
MIAEHTTLNVTTLCLVVCSQGGMGGMGGMVSETQR